jgi:hypothetical protein
MLSSSRYAIIARSLLMFIGCAVLLSLILVPSSSISAQTFNPGCNVAQLVADLATAGSNGQADTINLTAGCTYTLTSTLTVNADGGNLLTINGNGATLSGNNTVRVIIVYNTAVAAFNNFTITGGNATANGGGFYNSGTTTLNNITITNSTAASGGGISSEGTLTMNNSTVSGNNATFEGGGIYNNGSVTMTNSAISNNTASIASAISNTGGGTLSITGSTITGNTATFSFGTIYNNGGSLTLTNSTVSNNTSAGDGGAVKNSGGNVSISGSTISGNSAVDFGGGITNNGSLSITNSTLSDNTSDGIGGGIYNIAVSAVTITGSTISANMAASAGGIYTGASTTMTITNSTISGNIANVNGGQGGGIDSEGNLTLNNTTVSGNSAALQGGGIFRIDGSLTLKNSIVANSTAGGDCYSSGSAPSLTNSLIESGGCGIVNGVNGNKTGDPNLGTLVGVPAYHPLNTGSIAINAGSNALIPGGVTTDQAGNPRIQGGTVDMGSFESGTTPTHTPPAPDLNIISNGAFNAGLNDWAFSGTTQQISNGALQIAPITPGGSFFQFVNFNSAGGIYEVNFRAGNSSAGAKTLNLMVRSTTWSPLYNCVFGIPAYSPFQNYRMRFNTSPNSFIPMVLQGALSGDSSMGVLIDDITMVRKTGISVPSTECTVSPPPNVDLIYDGAFNQGTANWAAFNSTMQVVNIGGANGNVMEIGRNNGTPSGGFYQYNPYSAPANGVLQFNFQIGNQSNVARVINMLVRNPDWTDLHSCFITVPANTPLTSLQIKLKTGSVAWSNIVIQGWIQVGDYVSGTLPFRFDNLSLQYLPAGSSGTTECPAPIPMPQRPTLTPSLTATMTSSPTATGTETATVTATATLTETALPSATATATLTETPTDVPTAEPPPTLTAEPPTLMPEPPSATPEPPTAIPTDTATPEPPTAIPTASSTSQE